MTDDHELKTSRRTTGLVIEMAAHALSPGAIDRVMCSLSQELQYRPMLERIADGSGTRGPDEIAEAISRCLVREGIGESFYPAFTSEAIKSIYRDRTRNGGRYDREAFRAEFPTIASAFDEERLDVGTDGELCSAGPSPQIQVGEPNTDWIKGVDKDLLEELKGLLKEIRRAQDIDFENATVMISRIGATFRGHLPPPDQQQRMAEHRGRLLNMLRQRGVLESWGDAWGNRDAFAVKGADRETVRALINGIEDLLRNPSVRSVAQMPAHDPQVPTALPVAQPPIVGTQTEAPPTDPIAVEVERTHRVEQAKFWYKVGGAVVIAVILGALSYFFTPVGDWFKATYFNFGKRDSTATIARGQTSSAPGRNSH